MWLHLLYYVIYVCVDGKKRLNRFNAMLSVREWTGNEN